MADQAPADDRREADGPGSAHRFPWGIGVRRGGVVIAAALAATGVVFVWQASLLDFGRLGPTRARVPADGARWPPNGIRNRDLTGAARLTFGNPDLTGGLSFAALAIGLFGLSEILLNLEKVSVIKAIQPKLKDLIPRWNDVRESAPAIGRGSLIGFIFGIIPGVSHVVSTFVSYAVEKRLSRQPEQFGKGAIAGVAGPETANNAVTGTAMIPLLALGIPSIPATALLLSALTIHGVQPGPLLLTDRPDVFWGLVASM